MWSHCFDTLAPFILETHALNVKSMPIVSSFSPRGPPYAFYQSIRLDSLLALSEREKPVACLYNLDEGIRGMPEGSAFSQMLVICSSPSMRKLSSQGENSPDVHLHFLCAEPIYVFLHIRILDRTCF